MLYSGLFAGLVVLTKGLIGVFVFGVEIVFLLVVLRFEIKRVFGALLLSVIVFLSVFGWWYVYAFIKTDLYNTMVVKESLNRLSLSSNREFNSSPIYEYLASIATYNIIMVPFIFIGLKRHIWGMRRDKGVMLFLFFFLAYFISIHFLDSKYDRYLYPLMPFMSIAAGVGLASLVKFELKKVLFSLTFIFACFMVLYPYSTGQETYDELTKVKEFAERNSLSVCVDQNYYSEWEPKSGMIYYYGDGYTVGNCEGTGILITSKNGSCKGNILLRNRKVKACIQ